MAYQPNEDVEVTAFVTTALLGAGLTFDSGVLDANGKTQVQTEINASHDGTIDIEFCADAAGIEVVRSLSIPYVAANGYQFFAAPAFVNYIRYQFTNTAGVIQTDFYYTTKYLTTGLSPQLLTTNAFIAEAMVTTLGRNLLVGQNDGGQFKNVRVDNQQHLEVNASNPKTSFDEIPVAELTPIAQLTYAYNVNEAMNLITENNGGTISQGNNMAILQTNTSANGQAILESRRKITFRAGQGALARFDCVFTAGIAQATSRQWVGVGDANDGFLFGYNEDDFALTYRTNIAGGGSATIINQVDWNIDVMDGTGPSGMTLDPTKGNVYQVSYGAGFGNVNFSIESDLTGDMVLVHTIAYSNKETVPSTYNPTFPMCAEAHNGGSTTNLTLSVNSMSSFVEGEDKPTGPVNGHGEATSVTAVTTERIVWSLRNSTDFPIGAANINKTAMVFIGMSIGNGENKAALINIHRDSADAISGATWTSLNANQSVMEYTDNKQNDLYADDGELIFSGSVPKDGGNEINLIPANLRIYPGESLTFTRQYVDTPGTSDDLTITVLWQEDF